MKHLTGFLFAMILCPNIFSQVGIGTSIPNSSAALDVTSGNKGLLIPRMNLQSTIDPWSIPSPATSLLVYNFNEAMPAGKGFYYNSGTPAAPSWKAISDFTLPVYKAASPAGSTFQVENYSQVWSSSGIKGTAQAGMGVQGVSSSGAGVHASSTSGSGLYANSETGTAVFAASISGYALQAIGKVKFGGDTNPGYGRVLTSDASGNATWKNNRIGFRAYGIKPDYNLMQDATSTKVEFVTQSYDLDNNYNLLISGAPTSASSTFTVPVSGVYHFDAQVKLETNYVFDIDVTEISLKMKRSGVISTIASSYTFADNTKADNSHISTDTKLVTGDMVWVEFYQSNLAFQHFSLQTDGVHNFFNGHLVFAD